MAIEVIALVEGIRLQAKLDVGTSLLTLLILSQLVVLVGFGSRIVDFLHCCGGPLHSLVRQTSGILETKTEVMFTELGTLVTAHRADTLTHDGLFLALVGSELIVTTHPDVLMPLLLSVDLSGLSKLVLAGRTTRRIGQKHLIAGLEVIMARKVHLLAIREVD